MSSTSNSINQIDSLFSISNLLQILGALILVIALIFSVAYLIKKFNLYPNLVKFNSPKFIETIYSFTLTPNILLKLVKVNNNIFLIACTSTQVNLLKEYSLEESIEIENKLKSNNSIEVNKKIEN